MRLKHNTHHSFPCRCSSVTYVPSWSSHTRSWASSRPLTHSTQADYSRHGFTLPTLLALRREVAQSRTCRRARKHLKCSRCFALTIRSWCCEVRVPGPQLSRLCTSNLCCSASQTSEVMVSHPEEDDRDSLYSKAIFPQFT